MSRSQEKLDKVANEISKSTAPPPPLHTHKPTPLTYIQPTHTHTHTHTQRRSTDVKYVFYQLISHTHIGTLRHILFGAVNNVGHFVCVLLQKLKDLDIGILGNNTLK